MIPARLRKGAFLIALGNSFNAAMDGSASASWGILSNIARKLDIDRDELDGAAQDAGPGEFSHAACSSIPKLNLGMSGGAVINLERRAGGDDDHGVKPVWLRRAGRICGARWTASSGARSQRSRRVKKSNTGCSASTLTASTRTRSVEVQPNSPAAFGQLQINDQIVAVNGIPVTDFETLILAVNAYSAGDAVRLKIHRGDETLERTIVLAKLSVDGEVIATNRPKPWRGLRVEYASAFYRQLAFTHGEPAAPGVVVVGVEDGSPAAAAGLKRGQLIRRVGDKDVRSPREFAEAVAAQDGPVKLDTDLGQVTIK